MLNFWRNLSLALVSACLLCPSPALPADTGDSSLIPAWVFDDAGLDKLTPRELAVLKAWVVEFAERREADREELVVRRIQKDKLQDTETRHRLFFGFSRDDKEPRGSISAAIAGEFRGFHPGARFQLDNGQVWEQMGNRTIHTVLQGPSVVIQKSRFSYTMILEENDLRVNVRRLR